MKATEFITEVISMSHKLPEVKDAFRTSLVNAINETYDYINKQYNGLTRINNSDLNKLFRNKLMFSIGTQIKLNMQKIDPIGQVYFLPKVKFNAIAKYPNMAFNARIVTQFLYLFEKILAEYLDNSGFIKEPMVDYKGFLRSRKYLIDKIRNFECSKYINEWSSIVVHELVHLEQDKYLDPNSDKDYYRSYLAKSPEEFKQAMDRLKTSEEMATTHDSDLYFSSPQEIPAYAHQYAIEILELATDQDIDTINTIDELEQVKARLKWGAHSLKYDSYKRFNVPENKKFYMIYKRFMKLAYFEIVQYINQVDKRIQELSS